ncbi:uroporphyrinogen-III decarboxylase [Candidatus Aerophobetes bacterium]|nr:uroporphyrinogen-III decarboxylase [Candidatus Aerophobetes bacterium]
MKPRERLLRALSHDEPDRVPVDIGSSVTSIHIDTYVRLKKYLGINKTKPRILHNMQQVVVVDEPVLRRFSVDTRHISVSSARGWQKLEDGRYVDEWGIKWTKPEGSHYYDMCEHPLAQATLEDLDRYRWPDPYNPRRVEGLREKAEDLYNNTDYTIVLSGFGECLFGFPAYLRGYAQFYMDLISNKRFVNAFLDMLLDYELRLMQNTLKEVGKYVHVVRVSDDFGTEKGSIISPSLYREIIKPRQKKLYQFIKENSGAKILLHSCGSIYDFIPDLIQIGVDAINPVQVSAKNMDTRKLKKEFGDRITFWGGGCDTQRILPFGTVREVKEEVKRRIKDLAPGGGFVFTPVHNIQYDVSPEKICALYDMAIEFGRYPIDKNTK